MQIAFLLYPTAKVKVSEDTSFCLMLELARRGHRVFHFESRHLFWEKGAVRAFLTPLRLHPRKGFGPSPAGKEAAYLGSLNCVVIRKEPPFDQEYLWALHLLDLLKGRVFVMNDPQGIAASGEKLFTLAFSRYAPESCVTENTATAERFVRGLGAQVVVKPLDEKGGAGIFFTRPRDKNLRSLLEMATKSGRKKLILQRFIPTARFGDKRILILNGEAIGTFLRKPPSDDFRANLSLGASLHKAALSRDDRELVAALGPELLRRGLWFVGIDVIGKYLTEINVTSPAGITDLNILYKTHPERKVADFIESRV